MAERRQTKAEKRQAQGGQPTKADRKQTKARRREQPDSAGEAVAPTGGADESSDQGIELRLSRLEEAVATQSQLSEQLLGKLDEVLHEARKSARHAKTAVTRPGAEGQDGPAEEEGA